MVPGPGRSGGISFRGHMAAASFRPWRSAPPESGGASAVGTAPLPVRHDVGLRTEHRQHPVPGLSFRSIAMAHSSTDRTRWRTSLAVAALTYQMGVRVSSTSASETSETAPSPSSRRRPRMTSRWSQFRGHAQVVRVAGTKFGFHMECGRDRWRVSGRCRLGGGLCLGRLLRRGLAPKATVGAPSGCRLRNPTARRRTLAFDAHRLADTRHHRGRCRAG